MPIWHLVKHGSAEPSSLDQWSTKEALRSNERTLQSRDGAPPSITEYLGVLQSVTNNHRTTRIKCNIKHAPYIMLQFVISVFTNYLFALYL